MEGRQSKSADVYSFGITLWELITGGSPYKGLPKPSLCQLVVFQHKRPGWRSSTPSDFKALVEECWQPKAEARPSFDSILEQLIRMRAGIKERSKPLNSILARKAAASDARGDSDGESYVPPDMGTAVNASVNESMSFWVPTIMESNPDIPALPQISDLDIAASAGLISSPSLAAGSLPSPPDKVSQVIRPPLLNLSDLQQMSGASKTRSKNSSRLPDLNLVSPSRANDGGENHRLRHILLPSPSAAVDEIQAELDEIQAGDEISWV